MSGVWSSGHAVLVLQHGQHASEYAEVAAAKTALSTAASNTQTISAKVMYIQSLLNTSGPDMEQVLRSLEELVLLVEQDVKLAGINASSIGSTLDKLLTAVVRLTSEKSELKQRIEGLENYVGNLKNQLATERHKIMLGQLAYVIDYAAVLYVYGPKAGFVINFNQIKEDVSDSEQERQRWEGLSKFLTSKGVPPKLVTRAAGVVRKLRYETAHGTEQERSAVTSDQLREWGEELIEPEFQDSFKTLLKVASFFSEPSHPLVPASYDEVRCRVECSG